MALFIYVMLFLTITRCQTDAYKALVATMMSSRSHAILNEAIVKQLLKEGNEVTYIRSIPYKNPPPNLREVDVSDPEALPASVVNLKDIMNRSAIVRDLHFVKHLMTGIALKTLENKNLQRLLSDPGEHFDVVIVEYLWNDLLASLSAVFDCPLIWLSPIEVNSNILSLIDAGPNPAYVPDAKSSNMLPFTFLQRVQELWSRINSEYIDYMYIDEIQTKAYNRLIAPLILKRGRQPPSFDEVNHNASLVLGYSHVSMGEPTRLPQNYKPVGGYHIDDDIAPLPEDLKKIMDNAKDGVIYFSMGSNLKSKEWPEEIKMSLLKMLGELKQTVLWKFEDQLPNTPKNVHISNWLPQLSILAHPNCAVFITHGGLLSAVEALYFGVPYIGIPAFGDQFSNINKAVKKGFGLRVDLTYNIVDDLKKAIEEMISKPSYRNKIKEYSFIYHDRPVKPISEVAHWVRHVVQTRGAPHLRSPATRLTFYQRLYLDLAVLIFVILMLISVLMKCIYRLVCPKKVYYKKKNN